jgi:hypothetical protein
LGTDEYHYGIVPVVVLIFLMDNTGKMCINNDVTEKLNLRGKESES